MKRNANTHKVIVGVGSSNGDDAIGWRVLDELRGRTSSECELNWARTPIDVLNATENASALHVVDACQGDQPGCIHRWLWPCDELAGYQWSTSHHVDVVGALELGERLSLLPKHTVLWAIETNDFAPGATIDDSMLSSVCTLADRIENEINA